ncbi:RNA recognition motif containing protein [Cryptosporidium ryanae]|uniref:RNA recognition motif containing protein n=1 Tax=Cryptosporidium ryanae TaxID=515981 RepID=UPI003519D94D|nr:RNA recognition motif containing protein [Cryptosporidium ryanae]
MSIKKANYKDRRKIRRNNTITSIYVTNLPKDITLDEMKTFFSRGGIIKLDPETLEPKIKLYKEEDTKEFTGNALVVYKFEQSIDIAIKYLNDTEIRPGHKVNIEKAVFNKNKDDLEKKDMKSIGEGAQIVKRIKQIKAAEMEEERLLSWNNEQCPTNCGKATSRIVVLRKMYSKGEAEKYLENDPFYKELEDEVREEVSKHCQIVNVTCIPRHPFGIVCVKLKSQQDAETIIDIFNMRYFDGRQIEAHIYDGKTDFKASCI